MLFRSKRLQGFTAWSKQISVEGTGEVGGFDPGGPSAAEAILQSRQPIALELMAAAVLVGDAMHSNDASHGMGELGWVKTQPIYR